MSYGHTFRLFRPWAHDGGSIGWNALDARGQSIWLIVKLVLGVLRSQWSSSWGPRMEEILLFALLALSDVGLTLPELPTFLLDPVFRHGVLRQVRLAAVRDFWLLRFARLTPAQQSLVIEPVLNKVMLFAVDPVLRYALGQQQSTLNLDEALTHGQTIIADFAVGQMGGNNYLLGALLVNSFRLAMYRRSSDAKPYALILDECQEVMGWEL